MNTSNFKVPTVFHKLVGRADRRRRPADTPLRAEVLSIDQLRQHAIAIAESHQVMHGRGRDRLIARLSNNQKALLAAHELMTASVAAGRSLEPAGEWLIDNFYLIEEQIQTARRHFPRAYSQELPRLYGGPTGGDLRIYHIALELISHVDGKIDSTSLSSFVAAYQSVHPLLLGELWGIPIVLRLALIENLRRVAERIADDRADRDQANRWADRLLDVVEHDPLQTIFVTADMAHEHKSLTTAFVAEFSRRLQGQGPAFASPLSWIDHQLLAERGLTVDQAVQLESQQQASDQVSIGNSIGSLRFLNSMDWRDFVEELSVVEQSLRTDPAGVYPRMDFATRDRYRHVVENVSKRTNCSQLHVAEKAIELTVARRATGMSTDRQSHVGFFLVDKGLPELERAVGASRAIGVEVGRWGRRWALPLYLGAILSLVSLFTLLGMNVAAAGGTSGWALGLMTLLVAISSSQLALTLVNWVATLLVTPQHLPRMDYSEGVPAGERTLVAVPTMLTSAQGAAELLEAIELRYLANQDEHLHFAIVTDFPDASQETMPNDKPGLDLIREGIEALNRKYEPDRPDIFYLFHRPRRWNKDEQIWMGYERKRGKLADLNEFLLEPAASDVFSLIVGHRASLRGVRFVITLDTDTQLPRDAARELIATASHPLNRAIIDEASGLVCEGYGILQPRVATSLTSSGRSFFAKMCAGEPGIDPYTHLVSDVYQDLFRQGSFIGKGIYDLRVFEKTLAGRFPENLILSHDLLEGCHARSGLVSDVQLIEDFPARYATDAARRHRWIRGDWQIIRWLLPYVPNAQGTRVRNSLSWISRWKLFDNLRRSLVSPAMVGLLVLAWTSLPSPWVWTWSVTGIVFGPILVLCLVELVRRPRELPLRLHLRPAIRSCSQRIGQGLLQLVVLAHEAIYCGDAVVRTIWRLAISRRRRLEWRTASDAEAGDRRDLAGSFRAMWVSPLIALASSVGVWFFRPAAFSACLAFTCVWFLAPFVVWWISRPLLRRPSPLDMRELLFLRRLARKTWHFFETFVGPDDNWLPPDNFQEHPIAAIAHRTSPTNIGLSLLSHLAANDFGYLSTGDFLHRTRETLRTLEKLERFRGHYYNWYDTRTLAPLFPRYVSSVDSGNLVAHLLTLRSGLAELVDQPILGPRQLAGLADTIRVFLELAESQPVGVVSSDARLVFTRLADSLESVSRNLYAARESLETVITEAVALVQSVGGNRYDPIQVWATAIERHARNCLADLEYLNPWLRVPSSAAASPVRRAESGEVSGDSDDLHAALSAMEEGLTLRQLAQLPGTLAPAIQEIAQPSPGAASANGQENARPAVLQESIALAIERASGRMMAIEQLITQCSEHCDIEYGFLFDGSRDLLAFGYNVETNRRDDGFYDLLASEARLCSYVAIAQGGVPQSHWFALGRLVTTAGGETVLLSWSGSMFEYLMPLLVMPSHAESLLDQSCKAAVDRQIAYASQRGVPWGVSESGYNVTDVHLNYQ